MTDFAKARAQMVERQIAARGIDDPLLLDAMRTVPREAFVALEMRALAYRDSPLPIEAGQTISQPYIVAHMIAAADIGRGDHVLEIGAGSGYAAAVIGQIAARVDAVERHEALAALASTRMAELGYDNIAVHHGDGAQGWPEGAPYDAILVSARSDRLPDALKGQLAPGGRIVIPVGGDAVQRLKRYTLRNDGTLSETDLAAVRFVPLVAGGED